MILPFFLEKPLSLFHKRKPKPKAVPALYLFVGRHGSMGYLYQRYYKATIEVKDNGQAWFLPYQLSMRPVLYDNIHLLQMNWRKI